MKIINTEELLKLNDIEKIQFIKQIILGQAKFIGGNANEKRQSKGYSL
uniref:Uncharacterized protein n=1 Tax=Myoviridae sp. ct8mY9 TaxID=2827664 RepID=A0A8S5SFI0_9CAUD|nr:MAG TPA: hypothetical protein [Myoviridae sp. ct8mY9]